MTQSPFKLLPLYWVLKCIRFLLSPFIIYIFRKDIYLFGCVSSLQDLLSFWCADYLWCAGSEECMLSGHGT